MCVSCIAQPSADLKVEADGSVLVAEIGSGLVYVSIPKHCANSTAIYSPSPPNKWLQAIKPDAQRRIFSVSSSMTWVDSKGSYWGACIGLPQLGLGKSQRYAKFPATRNAGEPFHGYPVSTTDHKRSVDHKPPPEVLASWTSTGVLQKRDALLILRGKL